LACYAGCVSPLDVDGAEIYADVVLADDGPLRALMASVVERQRSAASGRLRSFRATPEAARAVSPERLEALLRSEQVVHGIAQDRSISNVIIFNTARHPDALRGRETMEARARVDAWLSERLPELFRGGEQMRLTNAGFFLYPPGGYMGWHTNAKVPGWRVMLSAVDEPGRSFFRYRDPCTGELHTSTDGAFNLRLNRLQSEPPVWHAVYSETYRFSLVYALEGPVSRPAS